MFEQITIIAPGLLGASLAMAVHQRSLAKRIAIQARRQEAVDALANKAWCQLATTDLAAATQDAEFVVICSPVDSIPKLAAQIAPLLTGKPIVTDVGSVKGEITRSCQASLASAARFVGSHPMAGSEKTGMQHADPDLFQDRTCFVTPNAETDPDALAKTTAFWRAIGSAVVSEAPDTHDEIVAHVSHLPHLLASALASFLAERRPDAATHCGKGLKDTTRIAAGDPALWRAIVSQNRHEIRRALDAFQDHLQTLSAALANEDDFILLQKLADGKAFRDKL